MAEVKLRNCQREQSGGAPGVEGTKAQTAFGPVDRAFSVSSEG
jgi:hypothetical protein